MLVIKKYKLLSIGINSVSNNGSLFNGSICFNDNHFLMDFLSKVLPYLLITGFIMYSAVIGHDKSDLISSLCDLTSPLIVLESPLISTTLYNVLVLIVAIINNFYIIGFYIIKFSIFIIIFA